MRDLPKSDKEQRVNKGVIAARYNLRVEDFEDQHVLLAKCENCGHQGVVPAQSLRLKFKGYERLVEVSKKLKCSKCWSGMVSWSTGEVKDRPEERPII